MHSEGKTDEARADLARLAIIRQQREEAAKKREEEKQGKEESKNSPCIITLHCFNWKYCMMLLRYCIALIGNTVGYYYGTTELFSLLLLSVSTLEMNLSIRNKIQLS